MPACECVCRFLRLLITSGMIWNPYDWLNIIGSKHSLRIEVCHRNRPNKSKVYVSGYFT